MLPDTICGDCVQNVDNFHDFIKHCLQNTIILEAQYNIQESCLKSKQKKDKGCLVDFEHQKMTQSVQTDDFLDVITGCHSNFADYCKNFPLTTDFLHASKNQFRLVDYDTESESGSDNDNMGKVFLNTTLDSQISTLFCSVIPEERSFLKRRYFDDPENNIISEISQRKRLKQDDIKTCQPKICKLDAANKRKSKIPKKLDTQVAVFNLQDYGDVGQGPTEQHTDILESEFNTQEEVNNKPVGIIYKLIIFVFRMINC